MKNKIIKTIMIINIILIFIGFFMIEKYFSLFSILFTMILILIFGLFVHVNEDYFQKSIDKLMEKW